MPSRLDCLAAALTLAALAVTGCNNQGHSGEACEADASALYPAYSCNAGLVCNTGKPTPTCEDPNTQPLGGPCGDDDNCASGLYCSLTGTCATLLSAGEACPEETGCGPGLVCLSQPSPVCVAATAEGGLEIDAASSSSDAATSADAAALEGGGSLGDAAASGGACGPGPDGGVSGACDGGMCCPGGAVGTSYCYAGDSGTCPRVP
jgi:Dickkopf N-terminal cysteine-rich region